MTPPPMVRVVWTDAQGDAHGWTPVEDLDDTPCVVTSVGHLLTGRKGHVTLALSFHWDEDDVIVDSALHIPEGMVISMDTLTARPA